MKKLFFYWQWLHSCSVTLQCKHKQKKELRAKRKAHRECMRMHNRMVREQQNMIAYQDAVKALKSNSWVLQANTLFNNFGAAIPVTNNLNFVAMDNNQVSLQLAFNGFNPGPNGLGGITLMAGLPALTKELTKTEISLTRSTWWAPLYSLKLPFASATGVITRQ